MDAKDCLKNLHINSERERMNQYIQVHKASQRNLLTLCQPTVRHLIVQQGRNLRLTVSLSGLHSYPVSFISVLCILGIF